MATNVKPIPEGYHSITPYLMVQDAARTIDFLKEAFGATERHRMTMPNGKIMHAELTIGDSIVMLGDAQGDWKAMPTSLYLYVTDVDATYRRALQAGGKSMMEPENQFYGDRSGSVVDPAGNHWYIATHIEEILPDEMKRRSDQWMQEQTRKSA